MLVNASFFISQPRVLLKLVSSSSVLLIGTGGGIGMAPPVFSKTLLPVNPSVPDTPKYPLSPLMLTDLVASKPRSPVVATVMRPLLVNWLIPELFNLTSALAKA